MIDYITKLYWTDPNNGRTCWRFFVYYKSRSCRMIRRKYTWQDTLPNTVVNFLLSAELCETVYFEASKYSPTYKRELYR